MNSMKNGPNLNFKLIIVQFWDAVFLIYVRNMAKIFILQLYIYLINRTSIKMLNKNVTFL